MSNIEALLGIDNIKNEYLSYKDITTHFGLTPNVVRKKIEKREFPQPIDIFGKKRWTKEVLKNFLKDKNSVIRYAEDLLMQAQSAIELD